MGNELFALLLYIRYLHHVACTHTVTHTHSQSSHSVISKKPRLFMKKKHLSTKKPRRAKKHIKANT